MACYCPAHTDDSYLPRYELSPVERLTRPDQQPAPVDPTGFHHRAVAVIAPLRHYASNIRTFTTELKLQ